MWQLTQSFLDTGHDFAPAAPDADAGPGEEPWQARHFPS